MAFLLKEDGGKLLLESGGGIVLDAAAVVPAVTVRTPAERLTGGTNLSWTIAHAGTDSVVLAFVAAENSVAYDPAATYGGVALPLLRRYTQTNGGTVWVYGGVTAAGAANLVLSDASGSNYYGPMLAQIVSLNNAGRIGAVSAGSGTGTAASTTLNTTNAASRVLDFGISVFVPAPSYGGSPAGVVLGSQTGYSNLQTVLASRAVPGSGTAATSTWTVPYNYVNAVSVEVIYPIPREVAKPAPAGTVSKTGQYASLQALWAFNEANGATSVANLAGSSGALALPNGTLAADAVGRHLVPGATTPVGTSTATLADFGITGTLPWTLFCRVLPNLHSDGEDRAVVSVGNTNSAGFTLGTYGDIWQGYGSSGGWLDFGNRLGKGPVQTVVVSYDGTTLRAYVNGILAGETTGYLAGQSGSDAITVGYDPSGLMLPFQQKIYEVGFLTGAWSAGQAAAYDAAPLAMFAAAGTDHALTAAAITTAAPAPDQPALGQLHQLTAAAVTTGAPAPDRPAAAQLHQLTASGVTTGAPAPDRPAAAQSTALAAAAVTTGAPVLAGAAITQAHSLTASGVTTAAPAPDRPALAGKHALTAAAVTTAAPTLGVPVLAQPHSLMAAAITTAAPVLGAPAAAQLHNLAPVGVTTGSPAPDRPTFGGVHAFSPVPVTTAAPVPDRPGITQAQSLAAPVGVTTAPPAPDQPAIVQAHGLAVVPIGTGTPTLGTPAAAQSHALTASGITAGPPAADRPSLAHRYALLAASLLAGAVVLGGPPVTQHHALAAPAFDAPPPVLDGPPLSAAAGQFAFSPQPVTAGNPVPDRPGITQLHQLPAAGQVNEPPTLEGPQLGQAHGLEAAGLTATAPQLAPAVLVQLHDLTASGITAGQPAPDRPGIGLEGVLLPVPVTAGQPVADQPGIHQRHSIAAQPVTTAAPILAPSALSTGPGFAPQGITAGQPVPDRPGLHQLHAITAPATSLPAPVLDRPAWFQSIGLTAEPILSPRPVLGEPELNGKPEIIGLGGMMFVSLDEAKLHLRVDYNEDDADIEAKLLAAEEQAAEWMGRPIPWVDADGNEVPAPPGVRAAVLLYLGDLYAHREAQVERKLTDNAAALRLLQRYRVFA